MSQLQLLDSPTGETEVQQQRRMKRLADFGGGETTYMPLEHWIDANCPRVAGATLIVRRNGKKRIAFLGDEIPAEQAKAIYLRRVEQAFIAGLITMAQWEKERSEW